MKYTGNYTNATTKAIKAASQLRCFTQEDGTIYLSSGYWIYKMNALEYAAVAQPATHCEAGNWTIDNNGKRDGCDFDSVMKIFEYNIKQTENKPTLERCPLTLDRGDLTAYLYHGPENYAVAFNAKFIAPISGGYQMRGSGALSPAIFYNGDEPFALVMPIRLDTKDSRAVLAYYNKPAADHADNNAAELEQARNENAKQAAELEALRAKLAELEAQQARPQEPAEDPQRPAQADGKTAAEIIAARFSGLAGVTTTIKGAQTAAPVIWLAGNTQEHAEAIKAAGGKWSNKKSAFYVRVA